MTRRLALLGVCFAVAIALVGCAPAAAPATVSVTDAVTDTPVPPTSVPVEPTSTPVPAATEPPAPEKATWEADGVIGGGEYAHSVEVAGVEFHWMNDDACLYGAMAAETGGWVSVGFDPEQRMQGANYILGYVEGDQTVVEDMYGTKPAGPGSHPPDVELGGTADVVEFGGREEGGVTVIEFKIPLDSGDQYDKPLDSGEPYDLVAASGRSDDLQSIHASRGLGQITLDCSRHPAGGARRWSSRMTDPAC